MRRTQSNTPSARQVSGAQRKGIHSPILKELKNSKELGSVQESDAELVTRFQSGDEEAAHLLFCKHYKYILDKIIDVTAGRWYDDDILQAGAVGLYEAARRFEVSRGLKFLTYAHGWIMKYIYLEVRNEALPLGGLAVGRDTKERLYRYIGLKMIGRTDEEIMQELNVSEKFMAKLADLNNIAAHTVSLTGITTQDMDDMEDYQHYNMPTFESPEELLIYEELKRDVQSIVTDLSAHDSIAGLVVKGILSEEAQDQLTKKELCDTLKISARVYHEAKCRGFKYLRQQLYTRGIKGRSSDEDEED